jgi:hypothetical protein
MLAANKQVNHSPMLDSYEDTSSEFDMEMDENDQNSSRTPLQLLPQLDMTGYILTGSSPPTSSTPTTLTSSNVYDPGFGNQNERLMLQPGGIIKGPWTREVFE